MARGFWIGVRAAFGLWDDFVNDSKFLEIRGGDFQRGRGCFPLWWRRAT